MQSQMMTANDSAAPAAASNPWLKPSEYARRHGVTRQTVWSWIQKGAIEVTRKGRRMGVRVRDFER